MGRLRRGGTPTAAYVLTRFGRRTLPAASSPNGRRSRCRYGCRRRRSPWPPVTPAPPWDTTDDAPRVTRLTEEIIRETRGMGLCADFPAGEFADSATILARYRIHSIEILRQTQKGARDVRARSAGSWAPLLPGDAAGPPNSGELSTDEASGQAKRQGPGLRVTRNS